MENIPTAKEFFSKRYKELGINHADEIDGEDEQIAIEFAKLHVKEALKEAAEKVSLTDFAQEFLQEGASSAIDKDSILNAYTLDKII